MNSGEAVVLIIDDEPDIRELLAMTISRMGLEYHAAANLQEARNLLSQYQFDVCLTDMRLPDGNGIEFVKTLSTLYPELPVTIITAHGNMEAAVRAMKNGAFDFISKPVDLQQLRTLVTGAIASGRKASGTAKDSNTLTSESQNAAAHTALFSQKARAFTAAGSGRGYATVPSAGKHHPEKSALAGSAQVLHPDTAALIGNSVPMMQVRQMIARVSKTNAPVWITGESGTGKELVAKLIHQNSARSAQLFIPINCGAIPSALMESELFGHKKGSFTGAVSDNEGLFRQASGGTLFLDEVAELPLSMQVKLLRAIQEKTVRPVGTAEEIKVDVRILSASHRDLAQAVREGEFRHDLYYRLNVINLRSPSLRERPEDIAPLARHILNKLCKVSARSPITLSDQALAMLCVHPFPGNVRELENTLERAIAMIDGDTINHYDLLLPATDPITANHLITEEHSTSSNFRKFATSPKGAESTQDESNGDRLRIIEALEANRWNRKATAVKLGLTYRQLRYRISRLGIDKTD